MTFSVYAEGDKIKIGNLNFISSGSPVTFSVIEVRGIFYVFSLVALHNAMAIELSKDVRLKANGTNIYIFSVNGLDETGEIINIDGNCKQIASIFYGHEKVYFVVGKNKNEKDYDSALYGARNIAAPLNAKRLGVETPCAVKGDKYYNCKSPEIIYRGLSVLWNKPMTSEFEVILIDEELRY